MREMRLHKREIRDPETVREILDECDVVRLGTRDGEGMFIVPVNYGYELSEKADFDACRDVAVELDCRHGIITGDYTCSYSYSYRSIMGNGKIRRAADEQEKIYGLTKIMEHMAPGADIEFSPSMLERTEVFFVEMKRFTAKERKAK